LTLKTAMGLNKPNYCYCFINLENYG